MLRLIACVNAEGNIDGFNPPTADLQRFQALTIGGVVIMGRKTWESLPRALSGRLNIVASRSLNSIGRIGAVTLPLAIAIEQYPDAWIAGGGELYAQSIDRCDWLYVSHVPAQGGSIKFPVVRHGAFERVCRQRHPDHDLIIYRNLKLNGA